MKILYRQYELPHLCKKPSSLDARMPTESEWREQLRFHSSVDHCCYEKREISPKACQCKQKLVNAFICNLVLLHLCNRKSWIVVRYKILLFGNTEKVSFQFFRLIDSHYENMPFITYNKKPSGQLFLLSWVDSCTTISKNKSKFSFLGKGAKKITAFLSPFGG